MAPAKRRMVQTTLFGGVVTEESSKKQQRTTDPTVPSPSNPSEKGYASIEDAENIRPRLEDSTANTPALPLNGTPDLDSENFNPYKEEECIWKAPKAEYLFSRVVEAWNLIEGLKNTGAGSKKRSSVILSNSYRSVLAHSPKDFVIVLYLSLQKLGPPYLDKETGIGETALIKAVSETYGRSETQVKQEMQEKGDLGIVAHNSKCSMTTLIPPARLTIASVWAGLNKIADSKGSQAQIKKRENLKNLLIGAIGEESKFIIRFLSKQMRMGVRGATVINALCRTILSVRPERGRQSVGHAEEDFVNPTKTPVIGVVISPSTDTPLSPLHGKLVEDDIFTQCTDDLKGNNPSARFNKYMSSQLQLRDRGITPSEEDVNALEIVIKGCYSRFPNLGLIAFYALHGFSSEELIKLCQLTPGIPVAPMLAKPSKGFSSVLDTMIGKSFRAEYKYDGERCQIHIERKPGGDLCVHLFSRNMESLDEKYPDVIELLKQAAVCKHDCILDSEVVAFNQETKKIESFQILSTRKRKDVTTSSVTIQVCLFVFDCLRVDGLPIVNTPLISRLDKLATHCVKEIDGRISFAKGRNMTGENALEELEQMMSEAVEQLTEGLMIKTLEGEDSYYEPSKRSVNWLKLKKDYLESSLCDSLDLCVLGGFYGMGKRSGFYGSFLMGVYEAEDAVYRSVCKVATGFSEEHLENFYNSLERCEAKPKVYDTKIQADVWFSPGSAIWEIRAADLSISPVHTCGTHLSGPSKGKGVALRFPRFVRERTDKTTSTSPTQILRLYHEQFSGADAEPAGDEGDELLII